MEYDRVNWEDSPSTSTPLTAENLNKMDAGIAALYTATTQLQNDVTQAQEDISQNNTALALKLDDSDGVIKTAHVTDKAITAKKLYGIDSTPTAGSTNLIYSTAVYSAIKISESDLKTLINGKMDNSAGAVGTDNLADKSVTAKKLYGIDSVPIGGSTNLIYSTAVYSALAQKYDASNVETGSGDLSPSTDEHINNQGSFTYVKNGNTVTLLVSMTFSSSGNYVAMKGLPFRLNADFSEICIVSVTSNLKTVKVTVNGTWINFWRLTAEAFPDGETLKTTITYII